MLGEKRKRKLQKDLRGGGPWGKAGPYRGQNLGKKSSVDQKVCPGREETHEKLAAKTSGELPGGFDGAVLTEDQKGGAFH